MSKDMEINPNRKMKVFDDHSGELVEVTEEMRNELSYYRNRRKQAKMVEFESYFMILHKRLYLAAGCHNFAEYCQMEGIGRTKGYDYAKLGDQLKALEAKIDNDGEEIGSEIMQRAMRELGVWKVQALLRIQDADVLQLFKGGSISLEDGTELSYDEIKELPQQDLNAKLRGKDKRKQERMDRLKADKDLLKEENKALKRELEKAKKTLDEDFKRRLMSTKLENNARTRREAIKRAGEYLGSFVNQMNRLHDDLTDEDDPDVIDGFVKLVGSFEYRYEQNSTRWQFKAKDLLGDI